MLICHCKGKTNRDIQAAVALGARDLRDLDKICGAGSACGGCKPLIESLLHQHHEQRSCEIELQPNR